MAFVVGINIALALRLVGVAPKLSLIGFQRFLPLHWYAVILIVVSGLALLLAYPAKALTNPVFYLKLSALTIGLLLTWILQKQFRQSQTPNNQYVFGWTMLTCWVVTIGAGRFLAYTHSVLLASRFF